MILPYPHNSPAASVPNFRLCQVSETALHVQQAVGHWCGAVRSQPTVLNRRCIVLNRAVNLRIRWIKIDNLKHSGVFLEIRNSFYSIAAEQRYCIRWLASCARFSRKSTYPKVLFYHLDAPWIPLKKVTCFAPRLNASIPIFPVPAQRSRKFCVNHLFSQDTENRFFNAIRSRADSTIALRCN